MCYTAGEVNNMRTPEQVQEILRCLAQAYPADCSLQYQKDYELLFAVRLQKLLDDMSWLGIIEYNWENLDGKNPAHEKRYILPLFPAAPSS